MAGSPSTLNRTLLTILALAGLLAALAPVPAAAAAHPPFKHLIAHPNVEFHRGTARPASSLGNGGATPIGYIPCDLAGAYRLPSAYLGSGLTIAVVDPWDNSAATTDLTAFRAMFPTYFGATVPSFTKDNPTSAPVPPNNATWGDQTGWLVESDLDIEWAHAMAPAASLHLVEAADPSNTSLLNAVQYATQTLNADIVSMSWGINESGMALSDVTAMDTYFPSYNAAGRPVTYLAATGDLPNGSTVGWPSDSTKVTAVGGTSIGSAAVGGDTTATHVTCASGAMGVTSSNESTWSGSVAGQSTIVPMPSYQSSFLPGVARRSMPDFALDGDPTTGVAVLVQGTWETNVVGGTSLATPLAAGILARVENERLANAEPTIGGVPTFYVASAGGFTDIISGSDGDGLGDTLTARAGFDSATGRGSLNFPLLLPSAHYTPVTPSRILDTRGGSPLRAGQVAVATVVNAAGVPASGVSAVLINVTVTDFAAADGGGGFMAIFPGGSQWTGASSLNFANGLTATNLVVASVGTGGTVSFDLGAALGSTADLILDVQGYWSDASAPAGNAGRLHPVTPTRIIDSRNWQDNRGPYNTPWPASAAGRAVTVTGQVTGGLNIPTNATGVVLNVTAVGPATGGFLSVFPGNSSYANASNVNFGAGQTIPNRVVAKVGNGQVIIASSASTDVLVDITGYITDSEATSAGAVTFTPSQPTRLLGGAAVGTPIGAGTGIPLAIGGGGLAITATAAALNVTVNNATAGSFVAAYPWPSWPGNSDLNTGPGFTSTNLVAVRTGTSSQVGFINASGSASVYADLVGWFG